MFQQNLKTVISKAITSCFYTLKPRVAYNTRVTLSSAKTNSAPTAQKSYVVNEFSCRCEARYAGRNTQRLADGIRKCTHLYHDKKRYNKGTATSYV